MKLNIILHIPLEPYANVAIGSNFRGKTKKGIPPDHRRLTRSAPHNPLLAAIYIRWCGMDYPMCSMEISVWPSLHSRYHPETWSRGKLGLGDLLHRISFFFFLMLYIGLYFWFYYVNGGILSWKRCFIIVCVCKEHIGKGIWYRGRPKG